MNVHTWQLKNLTSMWGLQLVTDHSIQYINTTLSVLPFEYTDQSEHYNLLCPVLCRVPLCHIGSSGPLEGLWVVFFLIIQYYGRSVHVFDHVVISHLLHYCRDGQMTYCY